MKALIYNETHDISDIATEENAAPLTATVFGWWRKDVPLEVSYRYWRDVHSIAVARAPGLYQYRLLALAENRAEVGACLDGIETDLPVADRPHCIAQILFLSKEDQQAFGKSRLITQFVNKDEQNLCDRNVTMSSIDHNAYTYVDRTSEATCSGEPAFPSFVLGLQQRQGVSTEAFRQHLTHAIAQPWSDRPDVLRLRLHLLEPFDESENSPYVSHDWVQEQHYQAWIELVVRDATQLEKLLSSDPAEISYADHTCQQHAQLIRGIHTFPITACYTMVANGKPTDVGLRGFLAVQTIAEAQADIQKNSELLEILYGDVVRGSSSKQLFKPIS